MDGQRDRNHFRCLAELTQNSVVAVLHERADGLGGIHDLERVQRRGQRGQHLSLGHGQIHHAELHQGMAASQQMRGVHVGDGAGGGNIHVAAHQDGADCRARLDRLGLLGITDRASAHHRDDARGGKLGSEALYCCLPRIRRRPAEFRSA